MDTHTVLTLQLARALAIYIIATGLAGLASPGRWKLVMEDYQRLPGLAHFTAAVVIGIGLTLVMFHSLWTDPLAIIVSLIAWIMLIEGLVLMILPDAAMKLGLAAVSSTGRTQLWALFALVAGVALLAAALFGHATL